MGSPISLAIANPVNDAIERQMDDSRSATPGVPIVFEHPAGYSLIMSPVTATASLFDCRQSKKLRNYSLWLAVLMQAPHDKAVADVQCRLKTAPIPTLPVKYLKNGAK